MSGRHRDEGVAHLDEIADAKDRLSAYPAAMPIVTAKQPVTLTWATANSRASHYSDERAATLGLIPALSSKRDKLRREPDSLA